MGQFIWQALGAGTKTDAQDGRNWVDETGAAYAQARYPGSLAGIEDDVYFDAATANGCTTNCDFSAKQILRSLHVGAAYNKDLGASAGYFKAMIREVMVQATAAPNVYLYGYPTGYSPGFGKITVSDGANVQLNGTITDPVFLKGTIACAASMVILNSLTTGYAGNAVLDVKLTLGSGMTLPSALNIAGGTINNSNALTALSLTGAEWTQAAGDLTAVTQTGGVLYWHGGNITTLNLYAGICDGSGDTTARRIGDAYVYQQGSLNLDNGQDNILVTGAIHNLGGSVSYSNGYNVAPAPTVTVAGASDAKQGIAPQTINNATVNGDAIYLGLQDRLEIYCTVGAIASGGVATFTVKDSATSGGSYAGLAVAKTAVFTNTAQQNETKRLVIWGHDLHSGSPWVRVECAESGSQNAIVSAVCVKSTF